MILSPLQTVPTSPRLILIFAGWGQDPTPFEGLAADGYDIAVAHSYATPGQPDIPQGYKEIAVVGWSYGTGPAAEFIHSHPDLPVTARIAVNGTPWPIHPTLGIPPALYEATLARLDDKAVRKFEMRMCGGARAYASYEPRRPRRDTADLRRELEILGTASWPRVTWDTAVIHTDDAIIPPANQRNAWETEAVRIISLPGPHLPDFGQILPTLLTHKALVAERFAGAEETYDGAAQVQAGIAGRLLSLIPPEAFGGRVIEIGSGTGLATAGLAAMPHESLEAWDLHVTPSVAAIPGIKTRRCDAETEIFTLADASVDLLVSASAVQWFNSLPAFLRQTLRVLTPGGTAAISTYGPETMAELHTALGTRSRFHTTEEIMRMMPPGLAVNDLREERVTLGFATPRDVMRHMRQTGVNAMGSGPSAAAAARALLARYPLDADGRAPLTYQPIHILLHKHS
ncbi:MAG: DUF452 family protein [Duncaniella sp.]|nr:DUF452 family protein [Duncaniella sp.]